jgi:arylsulfatase
MKMLRALDIEKETVVMFLSDNGGCAEYLAEDGHVRHELWPMRNGKYPGLGNNPEIMPGAEETYMSYDLPWANASNSPFRLFKHWVHEGGIATPFIVYWPSVIKSHSVVHSVTHVIDIMATCMEICGAKYPSEYRGQAIPFMEGESLVPTLENKSWQRQKPVVWEHEGNCAVRQGEWKLVKRYPNDWELYNMEKDRTEQDNMIYRNKKKAQALIKIYGEWALRCGIVPWDTIIHLAPHHDDMSD